MTVLISKKMGVATMISCVRLWRSIEPKKTGGGGNKRQLVLETSVDPAEHGMVVDMSTFSTGGEEVLCYATSMGKLAGLDLRSGKPAWELSNSAKFGKDSGIIVRMSGRCTDISANCDTKLHVYVAER